MALLSVLLTSLGALVIGAITGILPSFILQWPDLAAQYLPLCLLLLVVQLLLSLPLSHTNLKYFVYLVLLTLLGQLILHLALKALRLILTLVLNLLSSLLRSFLVLFCHKRRTPRVRQVRLLRVPLRKLRYRKPPPFPRLDNL